MVKYARRVENGLIQDWVTLRRNENSWKKKEGRNRWTESAVSVYQLGTCGLFKLHFVFLDASFIAHTLTHTHKVNVIQPYPEVYCLFFFCCCL